MTNVPALAFIAIACMAASVAFSFKANDDGPFMYIVISALAGLMSGVCYSRILSLT